MIAGKRSKVEDILNNKVYVILKNIFLKVEESRLDTITCTLSELML